MTAVVARGGWHRADRQGDVPQPAEAYASLRCAYGDDIRYAANQLGHEDPRFTLKIYTQTTKRRGRLAPPHRNAYDRAHEWALATRCSSRTISP